MSIFTISKYENLESLWTNNQIETLNLEYKSQITTNAKEVAKDISSFANSEGGIIIYGIEEDEGRATESSGIDKGQNSEKIQQIISTHTAPEVPMTIDVIDNDNNTSKEFLVVKIPKSTFYIHQVTTTGKFYVRNNTTTTQHEYNPIELKENDIALRYEARFRNKQNQESFIQNKETKLFHQLNWTSGIIFSLVPHVRISGQKLSNDSFREFFVNPSTSIITYDMLPTTQNLPTVEGRMTDPSSTDPVYVEINNDGSIFCCRTIGSQTGVDQFTPLFLTGELLHLFNRVSRVRSYYGGTTFRMRVNGSIPIWERRFFGAEDQGRHVSDFEIEHELPVGPINLTEEITKIFEKWFEALHIDDSLRRFPDTLSGIGEGWERFSGRMYVQEN